MKKNGFFLNSLTGEFGLKNLNRRNFDIFLIILSVFIAIFLNWGITYVALFTLAIWQMLRPLSKMILSRLTLLLIIILPVTLYLNRNNDAEKIAVVAFMFLVMTFVMSLIENRNNIVTNEKNT